MDDVTSDEDVVEQWGECGVEMARLRREGVVDVLLCNMNELLMLHDEEVGGR